MITTMNNAKTLVLVLAPIIVAFHKKLNPGERGWGGEEIHLSIAAENSFITWDKMNPCQSKLSQVTALLHSGEELEANSWPRGVT